MIEGVILGTIQGVAEWLPVSSEGLIALVGIRFFGQKSLEDIVLLALFLHLGTFFAALIYLRREVKQIFHSIIRYQENSSREKNLLHFLFIATLISGSLGFLILKTIGEFEQKIEVSSQVVTFAIGLLLLITAWLQLRKKEENLRSEAELNLKDSLVLGFVQALAVLPGLSRSGLTVSALLLRRVGDEAALRLSFLLSLPIVFVGNLVLNYKIIFNPEAWTSPLIAGLGFSFLFGLLTIHALLTLARKFNFGYFVAIFGCLMILSAFL